MDLIKLLGPQVPSLASTALWHTLGRAENCETWDLRTTLTVQVLRSLMSGGGKNPSPISKVQAGTLKDPGIKGKTWIAKATIAAPKESEEGIRDAVFKAVDEMAEEEVNYVKPGLVDTEVEWTGFRPNAGKEEALPNLSEAEKYKKMLAEPTRTSETTILYFHGGAYYLCDPITHRALCSRLSKETGGKVCSVRYRLSPQAAFPSQLLDGLMVYLSLLYPPPGSLHEPIPAEHIVFGGDSAGGNLVFGLLQFLLHLHRQSKNPTLRFYGKDVAVPLPAGASANSGWFDITRSMPTIANNAKTDYLPPPNHDDTFSHFPKDDIWPANPPRGDLFCDLSLIDHPLVSPICADSWADAPPLWFDTGEEMLTDEDKFVVSRAASQGVTIQYEEYQAMPHCFSMLLPALSTADRCMRSWGAFCKSVVEQPGELKTNGTYVYAKSGKEESVDVGSVSKLDMAEVRRLMGKAKERRLRGFEREGKTMPKPAL